MLVRLKYKPVSAKRVQKRFSPQSMAIYNQKCAHNPALCIWNSVACSHFWSILMWGLTSWVKNISFTRYISFASELLLSFSSKNTRRHFLKWSTQKCHFYTYKIAVITTICGQIHKKYQSYKFSISLTGFQTKNVTKIHAKAISTLYLTNVFRLNSWCY